MAGEGQSHIFKGNRTLCGVEYDVNKTTRDMVWHTKCSICCQKQDNIKKHGGK